MFKDHDLSDDPTIYIHISSKVEKQDAPEYGENWFVMINAPINKVIIVPNFIAKYPPNNPPIIVAKTPKNFEYVAMSLMLYPFSK